MNQLPNQVTHLTTGTRPFPCSVTTESTDEFPPLNPEFVCWLMGFPKEWANSKDTETQ